MDYKDEQILEILKKNAKLSTQQISKKLGIPITTVHNRIKKLSKDRIIKNYTVNLDNSKLGKNFAAYILLRVDYLLLKHKNLTQHELARKLSTHPAVEEAAMITGGPDCILKIRVKDVDEMNEFITKFLRNTDGVARTETLVILDEI